MGPGLRARVAAAVKVTVTETAKRAYNALPANVRPAVLKAVKSLRQTTTPVGFKGLTGGQLSGYLTLRVTAAGGEYRVVYKIISGDYVQVIFVGPRENLYNEVMRAIKKQGARQRVFRGVAMHCGSPAERDRLLALTSSNPARAATEIVQRLKDNLVSAPGVGTWWTTDHDRAYAHAWYGHVGSLVGLGVVLEAEGLPEPAEVMHLDHGTPLTVIAVEVCDDYDADHWVSLPCRITAEAKTASQTVTLWRGLQVADATDEDLEAIRRDPAGFARQHLNDPIGIHWTDDYNSAWNFAQGRDSEGYAQEIWSADEDQIWTVGLVLEGEVAQSDIVQPGTQEWDDYAMSDAILDYGIESEVTVRGGSSVRLTAVTVTAVNEETGADVDFHAGLGMTVRAKLAAWGDPLYYHGTSAQLGEGDELEPGMAASWSPGAHDNSVIWVADRVYEASQYGINVYLVEPKTKPKKRGKAHEFFTDGAVVVRQLSKDEIMQALHAPKLAWNTNGITLYHGTIGLYADRILREGLKPRDMAEIENHWTEKAISHPGLVYLSHESRMTMSRLAMMAARKTVINQLYNLDELESRWMATTPDSFRGRGITEEYLALGEQVKAVRAQIEADPRLESVLLAVTIPREAWGNLEPDEDTINYAHPVSEMTGMPEWMGSLGSDAVVAYRGEIPSSWIRVQARGKVADTAGMSSSYGDDWRRAASLDFVPSMA